MGIENRQAAHKVFAHQPRSTLNVISALAGNHSPGHRRLHS